MNRREFVRDSVLACASASLALPTFAERESRIVFRLESKEGESVLRSLRFESDPRALDSIVLPSTLRIVEHASLPVLFGLLSADNWQHRTRGAICSVSYNASTGRFLSRNVTPLSLGAVGIIEGSIDEHRNQLLVTTATGVRNRFRLAEGGEIGELVSVRKTISAPPRRSSTGI